ncbi:response regulator [Candidatus Woesearchaeota archaeon]|nr:response regulator [Candidatus Woesearchaeota archaeon]
MEKKEGDMTIPFVGQESSQYDFLFLTKLVYTTLAKKHLKEYSCDVVNDIETAREHLSTHQYKGVVTQDIAIAMRAADMGIPFIHLEDKPKKTHLDLAERTKSYCLDPTKKGFIPAFTSSAEEILRLYQKEDKLRVLIVDEEESDLNLYKRVFEDKGYEVVTASDDKEAESLVKQGGIDAVATMLEFYRTHSGGLHILQTTTRDSPETPVIIYTGYTSENILSNLEGLGAYKVMSKSDEAAFADELVRSVAESLGLSPETDGTLDDLAKEVDNLPSLVREVPFEEAKAVTERFKAALKSPEVVVKKFALD